MAVVPRWKFVVIVGILILSAGLKLIISGVIQHLSESTSLYITT
jgi:hypothetical protein